MPDVSFSRNCYYVCMAVIGYSIAGYLILRCLHVNPAILFPPCKLYQSTGYYCMGCGGTRALQAFLQGRFVQSFYYHPIVDLTAVFLMVFIPSQTLSILTKNKIRGFMIKPVHFYILTGVVVLQWVVKNAVFYFTGIHII